MVNPIDFGGHSSKVKVTMVIIDKCGVRGDATLCVVIFYVHGCFIRSLCMALEVNIKCISPFILSSYIGHASL